ncbi:MAG: signal recognition particle-docking protein FtsY [Nanobdellota archaeon]
MFKFLKKKIKEGVSSLSNEIEEESKTVSEEELSAEEKEKLGQSTSNETIEDTQKEKENNGDWDETIQAKKIEKDGKQTENKQDSKDREHPFASSEETMVSKDSNQDNSKDNQEKDEKENEKTESKSFLKRVFKRKQKEDNSTQEEQEEKEQQEQDETKRKKENIVSEEQEKKDEKEQKDDEDKKESGEDKEDTEFQKENEEEKKQNMTETSAKQQEVIEEEKIPTKPSKKSQKNSKDKKIIETDKEQETSTIDTSSKEAVHEDLFSQETTDSTQKKKNVFSKITRGIKKFKLTDEKFEEVFWEFEMALLENNVAMDVIEKIKQDLKEKLTSENISRRGIDKIILSSLKESFEDILDVEPVDIISRVKSKKPFVITIVGVNGSGKTTTIGKLIRLLQKNNLSVVVAAADTFRAAAIQQLEEHTTALGVTLIKHDYNSDAAAVGFDAIQHAKAKDKDVVLIDTAGRLQSNKNLMDELSKVVRVNKPDFNIFIGESITGNDCIQQAVDFNKAVGIDGVILSKADVDEKGGTALSVSYVTKKPIIYLGTGQGYDDLKPFDKKDILKHLGLEE